MCLLWICIIRLYFDRVKWIYYKLFPHCRNNDQVVLILNSNVVILFYNCYLNLNVLDSYYYGLED